MKSEDPHALPGEPLSASPLEADSDLPEEIEVPYGECWRCGKQFPLVQAHCPFCQARNRQFDGALAAILDAPASGDQENEASEFDERPLRIAMWAYVISLVASLIFGGIGHLTLANETEIDQSVATVLVIQMFALEAIDTVVIVIALVLCGRIALRFSPSSGRRLATWVSAAPLLAVMLALNMAYHEAIITFTGAPVVEDELLKFPDLLPWLIVMLCFQPAIVEELFMRQLFLGVLDQHMGPHGAVWISAVAFGLLHLGVPLSIPYLALLGVVLGYLRVYSGGILLPILFHFAHNAIVVAIEVFS